MSAHLPIVIRRLDLSTAVLILLTTLGPLCRADVRLPKIVGSNMVLQRNANVDIWGWAEPGERVRVETGWDGKSISTEATQEGRWQVSLKTSGAGGPYHLKVSGENEIVLENILLGEVWLASGQSNMEMPLAKVSGAYTGIHDFENEVAQAQHPQIRLFQVGNFSSRQPLEDVESGITMYGIPPADCTWKECSPESIPNFSATAYFFARKLQRELNVPVGVIDASWGGTSAEVWTPREGLAALGYASQLKEATERPQEADQKIPTRLYNGMIHPLRKMRIRGAIWYQGEGNAGRADQYQELFTEMIGQWRRAFSNDFPFYFVQIAPFQYRGINSAFLREAQRETLSLNKTGMVVTLDIGNLTDIHPKNKQEVGRRLALWALATDYGQEVVCSGPILKDAEQYNGAQEGSQVRLSFDYANGGLKTSDGLLPSHLEIAGSDQVFHPAVARIDGETLFVSSAEVADPVEVRYAFSNDAVPNLVNQAGLPASSFRVEVP